MDDSLLPAARRFAGRERALEALADRDESFRLLCSDFAEAQSAGRRWRESDSAVRDQRGAEYEELAESLAGEIAIYLDAAETGSSDAAEP